MRNYIAGWLSGVLAVLFVLQHRGWKKACREYRAIEERGNRFAQGIEDMLAERGYDL